MLIVWGKMMDLSKFSCCAFQDATWYEVLDTFLCSNYLEIKQFLLYKVNNQAFVSVVWLAFAVSYLIEWNSTLRCLVTHSSWSFFAYPSFVPADKAQYTRCDLAAYDLVASYGIESSSILYDTSYATYDFVMHTLRFIDRMQPNHIVYIGFKVLFHAIMYFLPHLRGRNWWVWLEVLGSESRRDCMDCLTSSSYGRTN